jgi:hypothetical protein
LPYRPQFSYPPPPEGWVEEEFEYYFDSITYPALAQVPSSQIVLPLQADAEFRIRAFQISGNTGNLLVRFWDALGNQLSQVPVINVLAYSGEPQGDVGRLPVPLNDELICPKGSSIRLDLEAL